MKKMKKIISVLAAGTVLSSVMLANVQVASADEALGLAALDEGVIRGTVAGTWTVAFQNSGNGNADTETTTDTVNFQQNSEYYYSAPYSLKLYQPGGRNDYRAISAKFPVTLENGKTYRISFKSTQTFGSNSIRENTWIGPSSYNKAASGTRLFSNTSGVTTVDLGAVNGKNWYEHTFDYTAAGTELYLAYILRGSDEKWWFVDFSVSEVSGEDLIPISVPNSDFDMVYTDPVKVINGTVADVWQVAFQNSGNGNTDTEVTTATVNFNKSYESYVSYPYSLKLEQPGGRNDYRAISAKFPVTLENGKTYRISFKSTQTFGSNSIRENTWIGPSSYNKAASGTRLFSNTSGVTSVNLGAINGKTWYEHTFDYTASGTELYLAYILRGSDEKWWFDDFSISEVSGGDLIPVAIPNSDFDFVKTPVISGAIADVWTVSNNNAGNNDDIDATIVNFQKSLESSYSSPYSLKLEQPGNGSSYTYRNIAIKIPVTLESGETYRIIFKSTQSFGNNSIRKQTWIGPNPTSKTNGRLFSDDSGVTSVNLGTVNGKTWYEHTFDYTAAGTNLYLVYNLGQGSDEGWFFDDFKVKKIDDGKLIPLYIPEADFDSVTAAADPVTGLTSANGVISWDAGPEYVNIYESDGVTPVAEYVTGTSYDAGETVESRTFVVKAYRYVGSVLKEAAGVGITVDGQYSVEGEEKFEKVTFDGAFSKVGEGAVVEKEITDIENGNIMASMTIRNTTSAALPVVYMMALYDSNRFVDYAMMQKDVAANGTETFKAVLNVSNVNEGNYRIKTFLWDGDDCITPLKDFGEITE